MVAIPKFEKKYSYAVYILQYLHYELDTITSKDVQEFLRLSLSHSSNLLIRMWRKGWLKRDLEIVKPHGRRFKYRLTQKGTDLLLWLREQGLFE